MSIAPEKELILANGLVLAEFDIDRGACVRTYYPKASTNTGRRRPIGINVPLHSEYFANHMLPDGAEKLTVGRTVFVVNRPVVADFARFPVHRFKSKDSEWKRNYAGGDEASLLPEVLLVNRKTGEFSLRFKGNVLVQPVPLVEDDMNVLQTPPQEALGLVKRLEAHSREAGKGKSDPQSSSPSARPVTSTASLQAQYGFAVLSLPDGGVEGLLMQLVYMQEMLRILQLVHAPQEALKKLLATEQEPPHTPSEVDHGSSSNTTTPAAEAEPQADGSKEDEEPNGEGEGEADSVPLEANAEVAQPSSGPQEEQHHQDPSAPLVTADELPPHANFTSGVPTDAPIVEMEIEKPSTIPLSVSSSASVPPCPPSPASLRQQRTLPALSAEGSVTSITSRAAPAAAEEVDSDEILYGLCAVVSKRDSSARRGGITKSVAILGRSLVWLEPFFPILKEAALYCCDIPGHDDDAVQQQTRVLKLCYEAINAASPLVAAGMAKTTRLLTEVEWYCMYASGKMTSYLSFNTSPFGTVWKTRIPLSPHSSDISFSKYGLEGLIELLGMPFMHLVHGIMTEKRIVLLTRKGSSTVVADSALALGLLGNLLDDNFLSKKVFPYASVCSVDVFQSLPGYIIGTLNPIFENERVWHWDLFCDLDRGCIIAKSGSGESSKKGGSNSLATNISSATAGLANAVGVGDILGDVLGDGEQQAVKGLSPLAVQTFRSLATSISTMRTLRLPASERNRRLQMILEEYMHMLTMMMVVEGTAMEAFIPTSLTPHYSDELTANLRRQCMLTTMFDDVSNHILFNDELPTNILLCSALRRCKGLEAQEMCMILDSLQEELTSNTNIRMFLRRMPLALGGLNPVAMQLTHPSMAVRKSALSLLTRVEASPDGVAAISGMNSFLIMLYQDSLKRYRRLGVIA